MDASFKSTMSSTGAAKGPGVKRTVDRLEHSVMQQAEVIARHEKEILQVSRQGTAPPPTRQFAQLQHASASAFHAGKLLNRTMLMLSAWH